MADEVQKPEVLIPVSQAVLADLGYLESAIRAYMNATPEQRAAFDREYEKRREAAMAICPYVRCTCGYHEDD